MTFHSTVMITPEICSCNVPGQIVRQKTYVVSRGLMNNGQCSKRNEDHPSISPLQISSADVRRWYAHIYDAASNMMILQASTFL